LTITVTSSTAVVPSPKTWNRRFLLSFNPPLLATIYGSSGGSTKIIVMTLTVSTLLGNIVTTHGMAESILHSTTMFHAKSTNLGLLGTFGHGTLLLP